MYKEEKAAGIKLMGEMHPPQLFLRRIPFPILNEKDTELSFKISFCQYDHYSSLLGGFFGTQSVGKGPSLNQILDGRVPSSCSVRRLSALAIGRKQTDPSRDPRARAEVFSSHYFLKVSM